MTRSSIVTRAGAMAACSALLFAGNDAFADRPSARHDPQRTGATPSTSNIVKPANYPAAAPGKCSAIVTAKDGTRIPYFLIRPRDMKIDGSTPTHLYGYSGFQSQ